MTKRIITLVFDDEIDVALQLRVIKDVAIEDGLRDFCTQVLGEIEVAQVEVEQEFDRTIDEMEVLINNLKTTMSNLYFTTKTKE